MVDPIGLEIRVYSSDAFDIPGLNHAFVHSTQTLRNKGTDGSSWIAKEDGRGDLSSPYNVAPLPPGMSESQFMNNIDEAGGWNNWIWIPWANDCHSDLESAFNQSGVPYPGAPNRRINADDNLRHFFNDILRMLRKPSNLYRNLGEF